MADRATLTVVTSKTPVVDLFPGTKPAELVETVHGQPMTTSRRMAEMFGKRHDNVLRSIEATMQDYPAEVNRLNFEEITYFDDRNRPQREYLISKDGFMLVAMGFSGKVAARWKVAFVNAFNALERALRRQQRALLSAERVLARAALAKQHSAVMAVLERTRRKSGKTTEAHHYANEARLIGFAMTGTYAGLDHDTLDEDQLRLLQRVETEDITLLVEGADYEARKAALCEFVKTQTCGFAPAGPPGEVSRLSFEPRKCDDGKGGSH